MEQGKAIHQQQFEEPIASLDIVSNSKDKDILAIGYANGGVGLYDMSMNFQEVGTLILHKQRIISNVYGFSERKNDVSFNYMITSDTGGRVSVWQFQKGK